jgi:hypothetical protein
MRLWTVPPAAALFPLLLGACSDEPSVAAGFPIETLFGEAELDPTGYAPLAAEIPFRPDGEMTVVVAVAGLEADEPAFAAELAVSRPTRCSFPSSGSLRTTRTKYLSPCASPTVAS